MNRMVTLQSNLSSLFLPFPFSSSFPKLIRVALSSFWSKSDMPTPPRIRKWMIFLHFNHTSRKQRPLLGLINRPYGPNAVADGTKTIITAVRFLKDLDFLFLPRTHYFSHVSLLWNVSCGDCEGPHGSSSSWVEDLSDGEGGPTYK